MKCIIKYWPFRQARGYAHFFKNFHSYSNHMQKYHHSSEQNNLLRYLYSKIRATGPITVAEYMKTVLTSPEAGYYMHRDVFGSKGDFITSPEISQMFGEMIGIWCVNEWNNLCPGKHIQVVELGPGRGTLAEDILRVFSQFKDLKSHVSLHLVEVSPALCQLQAERLVDKGRNLEVSDFQDSAGEKTLGPYRQEKSRFGQEVSWYKTLGEVPHGLSFFVAHEFLDALPIHKFQKTDRGWHEVLIDIKEDENSPSKESLLKIVLSPSQTPASVAYLQTFTEEKRNHVEVSPGAGQIVEQVSQRLQQHGGCALFVDYGHCGEKEDTFRRQIRCIINYASLPKQHSNIQIVQIKKSCFSRKHPLPVRHVSDVAFRQHKLHDPLTDPGSADLTADVDFSYLQRYAKGVSTFGPITQQQFLQNMGIIIRLQMLLQKAKPEHWTNLLTGYDMLTNPEKMGERFKFFAMMNPTKPGYTPAGFLTPDFLKEATQQ